MPKAQYKIKTDCFVIVKTSWKETNDMLNCILHYILLYFYCLFVSLLLFLFFLVMITANLYFNFISTFPVTTSFHIFQQCVLVLNYIILNAKCKLLFLLILTDGQFQTILYKYIEICSLHYMNTAYFFLRVQLWVDCNHAHLQSLLFATSRAKCFQSFSTHD